MPHRLHPLPQPWEGARARPVANCGRLAAPPSQHPCLPLRGRPHARVPAARMDPDPTPHTTPARAPSGSLRFSLCRGAAPRSRRPCALKVLCRARRTPHPPLAPSHRRGTLLHRRRPPPPGAGGRSRLCPLRNAPHPGADALAPVRAPPLRAGATRRAPGAAHTVRARARGRTAAHAVRSPLPRRAPHPKPKASTSPRGRAARPTRPGPTHARACGAPARCANPRPGVIRVRPLQPGWNGRAGAHEGFGRPGLPPFVPFV
ncbi:MAG: hypothetical protein J3K34DRAFT_403221 [Monoraphidium minutum]|nr:MAG: hypothetical protein J3K34DRAFT_403221 [Monoraphidium minutum]